MRFFARGKRKHLLLILCLLVILGAAFAAVDVTRAAPLNAQWYAAAEGLDPIFAIEGTDPDKLRAAVGVFLQERDEFASKYPSDERDEIERSLYPEDFLTLLPGLEAARQTLLAAPTAQNARAYHALLLETIDAYEKDAKELATALQGPASTQSAAIFLGGEATSGHMVDVLDAAASGAQAQKSKEEARFACAENYATSSCESLDALAARRKTALEAAASSAALPAPDSTVRQADSIVAQIMQAMGPATTSPLVALQSDCFPYPVTYLRTREATSTGGAELLHPLLGNDAFFWNVPMLAGESSSAPLYGRALAEGATLDYQGAANYYMCPDSGFYGFDLGRVLGVRELAEASTSSAGQALRSGSLLQLPEAASFALSDGSRQAAERYLEGSANFDETIGELSDENRFVLYSQRLGGYVQFSYLYVARSFASTLFLFGNPTFVPDPQSLFSSTGAPQNPSLLSWENDLSKTMSEAAVVAAGRKGVKVFSALSAQ